MNLNPKTLFDIALHFVANNAENIESLVGFPSIVGEKLFKILFIKKKLSSSTSNNTKTILKTFGSAYEDQIMCSLNLSYSLLTVNEYIDLLSTLFQFVTELDIGFCYLGDNHELIEEISNLLHLKKLILAENSLGNTAMRKITLPTKLFGAGPQMLEFLDLSGNKISDAIIPWLKVFPRLNYLDITGCFISLKGQQQLETVCGLTPCEDFQLGIPAVVTIGWAAELVTEWSSICQSRRKNRTAKSDSSFFSKNRCEMLTKEINSDMLHEAQKKATGVVEKRLTFSNTKLVTKRKLLHTVSNVAKKSRLLKSDPFQTLPIEQELFSQYCTNPK